MPHSWDYVGFTGELRSDGDHLWKCSKCDGTIYRLHSLQTPAPDKKVWIQGKKYYCEEAQLLKVMES